MYSIIVYLQFRKRELKEEVYPKLTEMMPQINAIERGNSTVKGKCMQWLEVILLVLFLTTPSWLIILEDRKITNLKEVTALKFNQWYKYAFGGIYTMAVIYLIYTRMKSRFLSKSQIIATIGLEAYRKNTTKRNRKEKQLRERQLETTKLQKETIQEKPQGKRRDKVLKKYLGKKALELQEGLVLYNREASCPPSYEWTQENSGDIETNPGPTDCTTCTNSRIFMDRDLPLILFIFACLTLAHALLYIVYCIFCRIRTDGKFWGGKVCRSSATQPVPDLLQNSHLSTPTEQRKHSKLHLGLLLLLLLGLANNTEGSLRTIPAKGMIPLKGIRKHTPVKICQLMDPYIQKDEIKQITNDDVTITWNTKEKVFILPTMVQLPNATVMLICVKPKDEHKGLKDHSNMTSRTSKVRIHLTRTTANIKTNLTFYFKWKGKTWTSNLTIKAGRIVQQRMPLPNNMPTISIPYEITYVNTYINQDTPILRTHDQLYVTHDFLTNKWKASNKLLTNKKIFLDSDWYVKDQLTSPTGELLPTNYMETKRDLWECEKEPFSRTLRRTITPLRVKLFDIKLQIRKVKGIATKRITLVFQDGTSKRETDKQFWIRTQQYYEKIKQRNSTSKTLLDVYDEYQEIKTEYNTCTQSKTLNPLKGCLLPFWTKWKRNKQNALIRKMHIVQDMGNRGRSLALGMGLQPKGSSYAFFHIAKNQKYCQECNKTDDWEIANELQGFEGYPKNQLDAVSMQAEATVAIGKTEVLTPRLSKPIKIFLNQSTNLIYYMWVDSSNNIRWTTEQLEQYVGKTIQVVYPDITDASSQQAAKEIVKTRKVTRIAQIARMIQEEKWTMSLLLTMPTPNTRKWFKYPKKKDANQVPEQYFTIIVPTQVTRLLFKLEKDVGVLIEEPYITGEEIVFPMGTREATIEDKTVKWKHNWVTYRENIYEYLKGKHIITTKGRNSFNRNA